LSGRIQENSASGELRRRRRERGRRRRRRRSH